MKMAADMPRWLVYSGEVVLGLFVYTAGLYVYRIYFSPLSRFPGPKLAAATLFYEGWFDFAKDGRWPWKIREMHQDYGLYHWQP